VVDALKLHQDDPFAPWKLPGDDSSSNKVCPLQQSRVCASLQLPCCWLQLPCCWLQVPVIVGATMGSVAALALVTAAVFVAGKRGYGPFASKPCAGEYEQLTSAKAMPLAVTTTNAAAVSSAGGNASQGRKAKGYSSVVAAAGGGGTELI
jgi:hypothetical protein